MPRRLARRQRLEERRRPLALLLALSSLTLTAGPIHPQQTDDLLQTERRLAALHVDQLMQSWLAESGVPGATLALVERGESLLLAGFGAADLATGEPADPHDTIFQVGALVRPMTAMTLLQLDDRGAIDLSAPIAPYLRALPIDSSPYASITAEHLLTHTAGIDERITGTWARHRSAILPLGLYLERRLLPPIRAPGLVSVFSSHGYALAGLLAERISERPFALLLEEDIFDPLGMRRSMVDAKPGINRSHAVGYRISARSAVATPLYFSQIPPAWSLATTAGDMERWMRAVLAGGVLDGRRVLSSKSALRMLTRQFSHHELVPGRSLGLTEDDRYRTPVFFQAHQGGGFGAIMVLVPEAKLGLFIAFNGESDIWRLVHQLLDRFLARAEVVAAEPYRADESTLRSCAGYYRDASISQTTPEKLLTLIRQERIERTGGNGLRWRRQSYRPVAPLLFRQAEGGGWLAGITESDRLRYVATPTGILEKLAWYATLPVQLALWSAFATALLVAGWPGVGLPSKLRSLQPTDHAHLRWPLACAKLAATLHFTFVAALSILMIRELHRLSENLLFRAPPGLSALLILPNLGAALSLAAAVGLAICWFRGAWTLRRRLRATILVAALLAFIPFLQSWRLLGWRL